MSFYICMHRDGTTTKDKLLCLIFLKSIKSVWNLLSIEPANSPYTEGIIECMNEWIKCILFHNRNLQFAPISNTIYSTTLNCKRLWNGTIANSWEADGEQQLVINTTQRLNVVVITTPQLHSTKSELRFCLQHVGDS